MSVCRDCSWNPAIENFRPEGHALCIARNKGKEVKDCDCQHRTPRTDRVQLGAAAVLLSRGDSVVVASENSNSDELVAGPESSTEGPEDQHHVAGLEIQPTVLLGGGVRQ